MGSMKAARRLVLAIALLPLLGTLTGDPTHHRVLDMHIFHFSDGSEATGCVTEDLHDVEP